MNEATGRMTKNVSGGRMRDIHGEVMEGELGGDGVVDMW